MTDMVLHVILIAAICLNFLTIWRLGRRVRQLETRNTGMEWRQVVCPVCKGAKYGRTGPASHCPVCAGLGTVPIVGEREDETSGN